MWILEKQPGRFVSTIAIALQYNRYRAKIWWLKGKITSTGMAIVIAG
jgi:hypothetical protein